MKKHLLTQLGTGLLSVMFFITPATANEQAIPRIISAGYGVTELLVALDAKQHLVGVDLTSKHLVNDTNIPILGYHRQLSAEGLLALAPTHLIGSKEMGPDSTLTLLKSARVNIETLPTGDSIDDFEQRIDAIAALTKTQEKATKIKAKVKSALADLTQASPSEKPDILFIMTSKGRPITVAGDNTSVNTVIELAGGNNPVAKETSSYKQFSTESIVELQPDYLLVSERTLNQIGGVEGLLEQQPLLRATPAVKNNQIISIPSHVILGGFGLASLEFAQTLQEGFQPAKVALVLTPPKTVKGI